MIPVIFIYSLFGLLLLYITVKLRLAYSVRRVPSYDQKMNTTILLGMRYLPLVYTLIAAWLYSNQQVFRNTVLPNESHVWFNAPSGHFLNQAWTQLTPGTIFYILFAFCVA